MDLHFLIYIPIGLALDYAMHYNLTVSIASIINREPLRKYFACLIPRVIATILGLITFFEGNSQSPKQFVLIWIGIALFCCSLVISIILAYRPVKD
jgi:hypothetical protein